MEPVFSRCGMRCDLCLVYRPNVELEDRRTEIVAVFRKIFPGYDADPKEIICDGCSSCKADPVLLDPDCKARVCVADKGLEHCGYCELFPCEIYPAEPSPQVIRQRIDVEKRWTWEDEALMEAYACKRHMIAFRSELAKQKKISPQDTEQETRTV